jgi:hypothetical protein
MWAFPGFGLLLFEKQDTGRLDCAFCRCAWFGGIAHLHRAWGYMLVPALVLTSRIAT